MNIDRDDEYATRYEMTEPTIEWQIAWVDSGFGDDAMRDAVKASLERLQRLDAQTVPVEPERVKAMRSDTWCGGDVSEALRYIDTLQSAQKLAQEERDAANDKALRVLRGQFTQICSYCGWEANREGAQWTDLQSHIKQCEHHPLVKAESINRRMVELMKEATDELREYLDGPCALTKSRTDTDCGCVSCTVRKAMRPLINEATK